MDAVERRTGLGRPRAKRALAAMLEAGILTNLTPDRVRGPRRYRIEPWSDLQTGEVPEPHWIWLPNALCDGVPGTDAPIERIRRAQRPAALRLLILLYDLHLLESEGGITWRAMEGLRKEFAKSEIFANGRWRVLHFEERGLSAWPNFATATGYDPRGQGWGTKSGLWDDLQLLQTLGLLHFVPYLVEGDDGEIVHAVDMASGEEVEFRTAFAAGRFARSLLPEALANSVGSDIVIATPGHHEHVAVIGIARLLYRPQTEATSRWLADLNERFDHWSSLYSETNR